ncbi:MAG: InlB B-repeat-containing protein [Firmicutes bacterium]|nr:InlB B-repeat-containing protein [Bacillota bacterium]
MESNNNHSEKKELKGFYGKAKISVKILDIAIVIGIVALFAVLTFGMNHRGYTVTFDSNGGTMVEPQKKMYGDHLDPVEPPTREGYEFLYWANDIFGNNPWNIEKDVVTEPLKLYAFWQQKE